jgi:cytochrome c peroxidase
MKRASALLGLTAAAWAILGSACSKGGPVSELSPIEELGKRLFFDQSLSSPPGQACAACHGPLVGFTGPDEQINRGGGAYGGAVTGRFGNRKPPTSAYAGDSPVLHRDEEGTFVGGMFWDGRASGESLGDPLAEQAMGPFLNPLEQAFPDRRSVVLAVQQSDYTRLFERVWGRGSLDADRDLEGAFERIVRAIAAYERSAEVNPFNSKFDEFWRAATARGLDVAAIHTGNETDFQGFGLTGRELHGLALFNSRALCANCHLLTSVDGRPPLLTDFTYDNLGVSRNPENPFYRQGKEFNPEGEAWVDPGLGGFLERVEKYRPFAAENYGKHKVPTLRNVDARPAPGFVKAFMHNGYFKDLKTLVHFYNTRDVPGADWPPPEVTANLNRDEIGNLGLTGEEEDALVAFMTTLTDPRPGLAPPSTPASPAPQVRTARAPQPSAVVSPEVLPDRRVVFRIRAPQAAGVRLVGTDIPGNGRGSPMTRGEGDVWEVILGPLGPGAYRYNFDLDGVSVIDPRNPAVSESNNNAWSLVCVPGSDFMDLRDVPHGSVAAVTYYSATLQVFRRLHVYTPPGYERGRGRYPVFYLLHGAGDCDDSWSSVGRAGFILDNLIAARKVRPMVVVMPSGHIRPWETRPRAAAPAGGAPAAPPADAFEQDFLNDIMPFVEQHYRVYRDQRHRAIAGLSMGGSQTLNIAMEDLTRFGYIGVYSSGLIGSFGGRRGGAASEAVGPTWEEQHAAVLDDARLKPGLRLFWFATGRDDFLIETSRRTVELLQKHGFKVVFRESEGGHTWINWRDYLHEFAQELFR